MSRRDISHPFYRPLWRRIAIVAVVALWLGYEVTFGGDPMWLVLATGMLAYSVWAFLLTYRPPADAPSAEPDQQ
ncbi:DUF3329 domain-containing protein [Chthonobacter albigriseus]|uniref:DUF3329 domain-containing protein n=1 Tax=Chthonobacter albigriseus TaxID=1683161 RepID=UPI0015EF9635|nr:DUF3329 domain-containing protein [Chthonobacter albigriseus]